MRAPFEGVLSRYAAINDRLRLMTAERLNILRMFHSSRPVPGQELDPLIVVARVLGITWIATAALVVFLVGTIGLLIGALLISVEVSFSHRALACEMRQMMKLGEDTLRSP